MVGRVAVAKYVLCCSMHAAPALISIHLLAASQRMEDSESEQSSGSDNNSSNNDDDINDNSVAVTHRRDATEAAAAGASGSDGYGCRCVCTSIEHSPLTMRVHFVAAAVIVNVTAAVAVAVAAVVTAPAGIAAQRMSQRIWRPMTVQNWVSVRTHDRCFVCYCCAYCYRDSVSGAATERPVTTINPAGAQGRRSGSVVVTCLSCLLLSVV